MDPQIKKKI